MRKEQKKQAEDFVKLLETAHDEIRKAVGKKDTAAAQTLLEDCQNGAAALGGLIEEIEGEGFVTISILEEYCDQVYQIYDCLAKGQMVSANKIYKILRSFSVKIANSVKNDIKESREVVFLPYKASMWDSLESVWQAADQDPNWDAYVIPIPYYDKKPDGSFGELHYELEQYPEYVPVMKYEDYNFEKRKPDMIFIHNPYDHCNNITSVHPFFYTKNLKQYTKKLVYIPYFLLGDINPENQDELKEIEDFCLAPGVLHADRVIVQSENMRKAYIKVLTKKCGEDTRVHWEKTILGIGSPKIDKVLATKKEDVKVPDEWMKIIRKPSGEWKKIILYNTSISALLQHKEAMITKMRQVFRIFQENRKNVALLWRPHPLLQATIQSMHPELWKAYQEILENYKKEEWGIYDDSPELERAIALCDAYYGDYSSLVAQCQEAGKSVMIQDVTAIDEI